MTDITLYVPDISCAHCVHTIKTEVGALAGVTAVAADEHTKIVTVGFEPPATPAAIQALLAEIEYPAGPQPTI